MYIGVVCSVGFADVVMTKFLVEAAISPWLSKSIATLVGLFLNFAGRRYLVFPESPSGPWKYQDKPGLEVQ